MATDQGPVVQSALLRSELVRLRKDKDLTQEQVARSLEWSASKLIRIEGGKSSITKTDLQALLKQYGVTSQAREERLQALARGAREPAWWNVYRGDVEDSYLNYVGYEAGTSFIRQFTSVFVPGLLQTPEYAQVLAVGSLGPVEVTQVAKLRVQRQDMMTQRDEPPWRFYIVDEAVIRRHIGVRKDPAIMPNQLRHIAETVEDNERITIRVIPFSKGAHLGMYGPFTVLEFDGALPDVLFLEGGRTPSVTSVGDDTRIAEYRDAFETLLDEALTESESLDLIRAVAEELME
jgi:transcriptional regulator with XRE-family HTH domain